ncbi:MAG: LrgB family protein [Acetatifactor sp.]|nr:LrgB family protein [Acetatifactor sp.]
MADLVRNSAYCGVVLSLGTYFLGNWMKKRLQWRFLNPLLLSILLTVGGLLVCGVDYDSYYEGAKYLSYLLTPATVCLAVPLYEQFEVLKKNWHAVLAGILAGVAASLLSILAMAVLFALEHEEYVTFLPKSITTAIGMGVAEELGGHVPVTVAVIIITGVLGNVVAEPVLRLFRIHEPVAKGIALGTASHAVGTARAMELGEVEGAMSSLSIVLAGILTVVGASIFAMFW